MAPRPEPPADEVLGIAQFPGSEKRGRTAYPKDDAGDHSFR